MTIKVAACQVPDIREDLDRALSCIETYSEKAGSLGVGLLCFPECFLQGYLVEDEQARCHALDLNSSAFERVLSRLAEASPTLVFGLIEIEKGKLFNTAVVVDRGRLVGSYRKTHLLAGESIFEPGTSYPVFEATGLKFGINICYDTNFAGAAVALAAQDADLIVCPANNMMRRERAEEWKFLHNRIRAERANETGLWLISSDVTGERDNRISYGPTAVINPEGLVVAQVPLFEVGMVVMEIGLSPNGRNSIPRPVTSG
ncbi:MAG: carbon-nitrogen hydrolase family protein [Gemmatimonadota bacterium]|nr:carbon-nitrogen hydrolase family protein [Gemmatimonadota bacterium]